MRWTVHSERLVYDSPWVQVALADVEYADGTRVPEHHLVRTPAQVAGALVHDVAADTVLVLWRHRFITDSWGYEIPAGRIEPGETPVEAAEREAVEETGWRPADLAPLARWHPSNGLLDQTFHAFVATGAEHVGPPVDVHEAERVEWLPTADLERHYDEGRVVDGMSVVALLAFLRRRARG